MGVLQMKSRWVGKLQWKNSKELQRKMKKLTINDDSCQEAFLLVGVSVVGLALLVPEAWHSFRAGQVLTHSVLHTGSPAVLPAWPWAVAGKTNQGQQEQHSFLQAHLYLIFSVQDNSWNGRKDPSSQMFLAGGQILLSVALTEDYSSSFLDL